MLILILRIRLDRIQSFSFSNHKENAMNVIGFDISKDTIDVTLLRNSGQVDYIKNCIFLMIQPVCTAMMVFNL
jgi:hypothetical protein